MKAVKRIRRGTRKHGATILTVFAAVGVGITAFLAAKATPEVQEALDEEKERVAEELSDEEGVKVAPEDVKLGKGTVLKIAGKKYAKAIVAGLLTLTCIVGSRVISAKDLAGVTATCGTLSTMYNEHLKKTEEIAGKETADKIRRETAKKVAEDRVKYGTGPSGDIIKTGLGEEKFYDAWTGKKFYASKTAIRTLIEDLNDDLYEHRSKNPYSDSIVSLEQVHEKLNINDRTCKALSELVWDANSDNNRIDVMLEDFIEIDGQLFTIMDFRFPPKGQSECYF